MSQPSDAQWESKPDTSCRRCGQTLVWVGAWNGGWWKHSTVGFFDHAPVAREEAQ